MKYSIMQYARTTPVLASARGPFFRNRGRGTMECIFLAGPAQQKLFRQHFGLARAARAGFAHLVSSAPLTYLLGGGP